MLANQGGLEPFFDQPLARPRDRVDTALQRRRDLAVAPALTTVRGVGFQQDPGLQQLLCWMVSAMDKGGEMLTLLMAQCHYVFLYRDLFSGHQSAPSAATEPSNQTNTAESMTGATSLGATLPFRRSLAGSETKEYRLTAKPAIVNLTGDRHPDTAVWSYDGTVPGPEIRIRQGDPVRMVVNNKLGEDTTVHWHGIRLPNAM